MLFVVDRSPLWIDTPVHGRASSRPSSPTESPEILQIDGTDGATMCHPEPNMNWGATPPGTVVLTF